MSPSIDSCLGRCWWRRSSSSPSGMVDFDFRISVSVLGWITRAAYRTSSINAQWNYSRVVAMPQVHSPNSPSAAAKQHGEVCMNANLSLPRCRFASLLMEALRAQSMSRHVAHEEKRHHDARMHTGVQGMHNASRRAGGPRTQSDIQGARDGAAQVTTRVAHASREVGEDARREETGGRTRPKQGTS